MVLVHGAGVSSRYLVPLLGALEGRRPAVAPDLPGMGASPGPAPRRVADAADALAAWWCLRDGRATTWVGNSMGAQVVLEVARRHPALVDRVLLLGPTVDAATRTLPRQLARLLLDALRERPSLVLMVLAELLQHGPAGPARLSRAAVAHAPEHTLAGLAVPVTVVRGERDPLVPCAWASALASAAAEGSYVEVPGAAHAVHHSHPDAVAALVLDDTSKGRGLTGCRCRASRSTGRSGSPPTPR